MKRMLALTSAVGAFASTTFAAPAPTQPDILPIAVAAPAPPHVDSDSRHRLIRHGTGLEERTSPTNLAVSPNHPSIDPFF